MGITKYWWKISVKWMGLKPKHRIIIHWKNSYLNIVKLRYTKCQCKIPVKWLRLILNIK